MSTWLPYLLSGLVVVLVVGLGYVVYRWGPQKEAVTSAALGVSGVVFKAIAGFLKDDPNKTDPHDYLDGAAELSAACAVILKKHTEGVPFDQTKTDLKNAVRKVVDKFPELKGKVTDDVIDKEVTAALFFIGAVPKVKDILKK